MVAWLIEVTQSLDKPSREREREGKKEKGKEEWREVSEGRREEGEVREDGGER